MAVLCCICGLTACKSRPAVLASKKIIVDQHFLDSIMNASDSTYSKPYFSRDFATAIYFVNKYDSSVTQVMKDQDSVIRQIIITRGKRKIYAAQYFPGGQLVESVNLDLYGQNNGAAQEYWNNGVVKSSGEYYSGMHIGVWKNFDSSGNLLSTDKYGKDGQVTAHKEE